MQQIYEPYLGNMEHMKNANDNIKEYRSRW